MNRWTKFNSFFLLAIANLTANPMATPTAIAGIGASLLLGTGAIAQVRNFPQEVMRAKIAFVAPPQVLVDGRSEFLAPGVRVRNEQNLLALTGSLLGQIFTVNYLRDPAGLIREIWILTPQEASTWPDGTPLPVGKSVYMGG